MNAALLRLLTMFEFYGLLDHHPSFSLWQTSFAFSDAAGLVVSGGVLALLILMREPPKPTTSLK